MKILLLNIFALISISCYTQSIYSDSLRLSVSPAVNQEDVFNQQIITTLTLFLSTKDNSYTNNKYWSNLDFENYIYPYAELKGIESGKLGNYFYQPSVMEIIPTNIHNKKIVKIAFIGHNKVTNDNIIKAIYNIVATVENGHVVFSKFLNYITKKWKSFTEASITYKVSPTKIISRQDIQRQKKDIIALCKFLNTRPIDITYYSCTTPKEVFELKGFDYHPLMYIDSSGGFKQDRNIVISGNNSEFYTHEITHVYLEKLFPSIHSFLNEGFATYTGGSGRYGYNWHRTKFKKYLNTDPDISFDEYLQNPYERLYYEMETPIPYLLGALVCERTLRLYGKEKLFEIFRSKANILETLKIVGLTKENLLVELLEEIKRPLSTMSHF